MSTQIGQNGAANGELKDSLVTGQTNQGMEFQGTLLRLTRYAAIFQIYGPSFELRASEALEHFKIFSRERSLYSGRAIIRNLIDAGSMSICEVKLDESSWTDVEFNAEALHKGKLRDDFNIFMEDWQRLYKVRPEFKVVVADMQSFLMDLRLWLEQIELNVRAQPSDGREEFERQVLQNLCQPVLPTLGSLFERFESVSADIDKELQPPHGIYAKRQLHPTVLCSPFMSRTFRKPLGYAGDYEMVNMMAGEAFQGGSVFAKILNSFFLNTPPVVAHRNRIDYLLGLLVQETDRMARRGKVAKVFNLGCGPALEVQAFLEKSPLSSRANFTLLDFNDETVRYTERVLNQIQQKYNRHTPIRVIKKSVAQLLKGTSKSISELGGGGYDLVYCAGLFDYLTNPVCQKLLDLFYELAAPGGFVVATNVNVNHPSLGWMEYVVDWHLCYRDAREMKAIVPNKVSPEAVRIFAEPTGVNIFVEIRKPENA